MVAQPPAVPGAQNQSTIYFPAAAKAPATAAIPLHPGPHLFLDERLIESSSNITRRVHGPGRDPAIPNPLVTGKEDGCFQPYMTVLRDPKTGRFRLWYGAHTADFNSSRSHLGYLESVDGIRWDRPHRVLPDPAPIQFGVSVLDGGPDDPNPARRFKFGWYYGSGLRVATSPDGLSWQVLSPEVVLEHSHDINSLFWDPVSRRYVATVSCYVTGPSWSGQRRVTQQSTSTNLLHWQEPWFVLTPDDRFDEGQTQFYAMDGYLRRGDLLIGMVKVLRDDLKADSPPDPPDAYGIGYTTLAWSHDGQHWVRDREKFFDRDPQRGAWDHAHSWIDEQLPVGDEVYLYYGGYRRGHKVNRFEERQIGLVKIKRDRYVAREAASSGGSLRTPLVILNAEAMTLNVDARSGEVQVQALTPEGRAIPGFDRTDCEVVRGDALAAPVRWAQPLSVLKGRPVRLEFFLSNARLFSFELAPRPTELSLVERSGVARRGEPVTSGVPFPKGALRSADQVRLLRDGQEVPAQFRAAGLWRPDESIRWLLVDVQTDLPANGRQTYTIECGDGVSAKAKPGPRVRIEESDDHYVVDTGAARFDVNKKTFDLFREVQLEDGTMVVPPPSATQPRFGAVLRGVRPMVTRAIPGRANQGRSHLIHVVSSPAAGLEDYTLRFTAPREFEVTGAKSGLVGRGAYMKDFTSKDGLVSIPAGAWLNYAFPQAGDAYHFRVIPDGHSAVSESVWDATVLESGPLRSVIRLKGSLGPARAPVLEFTAWYHFYAGSARVKLVFTLENNNHGGRTPEGNARNADIGGINCVFFDAMNLRLPLKLGNAGRVGIGGSAEALPLTVPLNAKAEIYQDSGGGEHWNRYQAAEFHPRPNSFVAFKGYRVFSGEAELAAGDRALGWLDVSDGGKGLTVSVADFWQNYPKSLSAHTDGTVEIGLFPGRYAADFPMRSGEHKTHEVLFFFHLGEASEDGTKALARAFSDPLRLEPSPQWFASTRALGDLHPFDMENYPPYEIRNLSAIGVFPDGTPRGPSLLSRREEHEFYGWMDYGDVPIDFEAPSGQWGMKYDLDCFMAQQWARSLNPRWWDLFVAADRHTRDIDIHHQPHYPGLHFVKGGVWAHSLHAEPGHKNPHRNRNHFTQDLCFGARGTATLYYLTGDWKARDACLEIAENALAEYMSPQRDPGAPDRNNRMGWRGDGCTLHRLLEGYVLSGDEKFLQHARWQIQSCAFDGKPPKHEPISLWSSLFYMEALMRYLEMFPNDASANAHLLAHAETLRKSIHPENGIFYTITPQPDGSVAAHGDCSHYNVMAADILAFAHRLTGRGDFLDAARRCFAYGVKNANGRDSTPTYYQVHSANGAMHGNVFMVIDSAARNR